MLKILALKMKTNAVTNLKGCITNILHFLLFGLSFTFTSKHDIVDPAIGKPGQSYLCVFSL